MKSPELMRESRTTACSSKDYVPVAIMCFLDYSKSFQVKIATLSLNNPIAEVSKELWDDKSDEHKNGGDFLLSRCRQI